MRWDGYLGRGRNRRNRGGRLSQREPVLAFYQRRPSGLQEESYPQILVLTLFCLPSMGCDPEPSHCPSSEGLSEPSLFDSWCPSWKTRLLIPSSHKSWYFSLHALYHPTPFVVLLKGGSPSTGPLSSFNRAGVSLMCTGCQIPLM